jgi:hypothetical protein
MHYPTSNFKFHDIPTDNMHGAQLIASAYKAELYRSKECQKGLEQQI